MEKAGREGTAAETGTRPAAAAYRKCKAEEAAFTPVPADERYSMRAERVAKRSARPRTSADIIMPAAAAQARVIPLACKLAWLNNHP